MTAAPTLDAVAENVLPHTSQTSLPVEHAMLPMPSGRALDVHVYTPPSPRGVIIFSHGGLSSPTDQAVIIGRLRQEGYAVLAPLHADSHALPEGVRKSMQAAFPDRIGEMQAAAAYARQRFAGLPMGAVGYSFGSLFVQMSVGAVDYAAPARIEGLKAALSFSSPGIIPGLIDPARAYANVGAPTMMISGTEDRVPGFVANPADHLVSFERAPAGNRYAIIVKGGTHESLAGADPAFEAEWAIARAFLNAYVLGDVEGKSNLDATRSSDTIVFLRR